MAIGKGTLQREASQYVRWALRTAQGRNYKPAFTPKTDAEMEAEGKKGNGGCLLTSSSG